MSAELVLSSISRKGQMLPERMLTSPLDLPLNLKTAHERMGTSVVRYKTARNAHTLAASSGSDANIPASLLVIASIVSLQIETIRLRPGLEPDEAEAAPEIL